MTSPSSRSRAADEAAFGTLRRRDINMSETPESPPVGRDTSEAYIVPPFVRTREKVLMPLEI